MSALRQIVTQAHVAPLDPPTPLKMLRMVNGLSQTELARLADLDRATIGRLEKGLMQPQGRTARKLGLVLNCNPDVLFPR